MENAGLCLKLCKEWDLISISVGGVTGNITMIVHFSEHFIECLYYEWMGCPSLTIQLVKILR